MCPVVYYLRLILQFVHSLASFASNSMHYASACVTHVFLKNVQVRCGFFLLCRSWSAGGDGVAVERSATKVVRRFICVAFSFDLIEFR